MKFMDRKGAAPSGEWIGFLEKGVILEGRLELAGTFRIDCQMKGTIVSSSTVVIGENAKVEGEIDGNHVVVGGRFDGVLKAKGRVEILAKGVVRGEVHAPCMVIEAGGILDGRCHMTNVEEGKQTLTIPIRAAAATTSS
ncbi:MAG TPA: polymer-forming cytoskeletal protein [Candidatus Acidoferrales bacterium]|nr:polymer-forming cytoskeletal protein [Candidatus Acidoferrales bacterium]